MGVRIQELPETTGINKEDLLIVEDGQGTKKGTVQQLDEALGVSQLKEDIGNKAPAIIEKASGKTIIVNDSSILPIKSLSGTGKIIITGKNILDDTKREPAYFVPFEAKSGTLFTLITNGELSAGGNIKFISESDEELWFAINAGKTKASQKIQKM